MFAGAARHSFFNWRIWMIPFSFAVYVKSGFPAKEFLSPVLWDPASPKKYIAIQRQFITTDYTYGSLLSAH